MTVSRRAHILVHDALDVLGIVYMGFFPLVPLSPLLLLRLWAQLRFDLRHRDLRDQGK